MYGQDCCVVDRNGCERFENAVLGEELYLLQAGSGGGGGGGARAGVERVRFRAVCHPILLQLQVTCEGVNVVDDLVTGRRFTVTAEVRNNWTWRASMTTFLIHKLKNGPCTIESRHVRI